MSPSRCQRDHGSASDRPWARSPAADDRERERERATWFEYRRSAVSRRRLVRGAGIRDSYSFLGRVQYPRWGPAPDISHPARASPPSPPSSCLIPSLARASRARPAHSLPSEITAVALTAFSHVLVARVALIVLGNERERLAKGINKREREREEGMNSPVYEICVSGTLIDRRV